MKWSGVPFTHICEWKRCSPSSGSSSSSGWTFVVAMVTLGSASMIHFPLSGLNQSLSQHLTLRLSSQPTMIVWSDIHQCCAKGFCGTHTTFQCPSSTSHYPSFLVAWTGCPRVGPSFLLSFVLGVRATFTMLLCDGFVELKSHLLFFLNFCSILTTYR
jgi:hypothetical protein